MRPAAGLRPYDEVLLRIHYDLLKDTTDPGLLFELRFWNGVTGVLVATIRIAKISATGLLQSGVVEIYTMLPFARGPYRIDCGFDAQTATGWLDGHRILGPSLSTAKAIPRASRRSITATGRSLPTRAP